MNKKPIEKLYAWLSQDEKGNEGIVALTFGPAVTGSKELADKMGEIMEANKDEVPSNLKIVLGEFQRVRQ